MSDLKDKKKNAILDYFQESFQELKKVTWPTRNQAVKLTILVLVFCTVSAVVIGAVDALLSYGHSKLIEIAPVEVPATVDNAIPYTAEAQPVSGEAPVTPTASVTINGQTQQIPITK